MNEIDQVTIRLAKKKDRAAFKRIYDFYSPFVWKIAFRTLHGDAEAAGEAVQDTFIRVHESLPKFSGESALSTWLYRIVFNVCLTSLSKQKRSNAMQQLDENIQGATSVSDNLESKEQVEAILAGISAEERFLLTGREIMDLSYEELAVITGRNPGSLRTQLSRLKEEIRKKLKDKE
jgi:RNA polymerase sigma-70 factor, ECF subfamily